MARKAMPAAPVAEKKPHSRSWHGEELADPYAWLKAANWQEVMRKPDSLPQDIRDYLEAENAYSAAWFKPLEALQKTLIKEMRGRIKEDESSVPLPDGPFAYYRRYRKGGEHPIFCRSPRNGADEQALLDGDELAKGRAYFHFGHVRHSPDHKLIAWAVDDKGSEYFNIRVRDPKTGKDLPDEIANTDGNMVWQADSKAFYYIKLNDEHRPQFVYRHILGTSPDSDQLIYTEPDAGFFVNLSDTLTGRYAVISCHDHETSECWLVDLHAAGAMPRCVAVREPGRIYSVADGGSELIILTNADGAEDFKVVSAPPDKPQKENWRDILPAKPGTFRISLLAMRDFIARLERENGLPRLIIRRRTDGAEHEIPFAEEVYMLNLREGYEYATDTLRFVYSSLTTPSEVWDYDMRKRERQLRKRETIPSGHNSEDYVTRRLMARSADGAEVPISLLMRRETKIDGSAPLYLYGYGSYGITIDAHFRTNPLSLVDRGFIFAIAHVRGGTDKGWRWYLDGKRDKKPNTFHDFLACAEYLIGQNYTAPRRIVAHGGSAGGMLMGAIANLRPDLFAGVIAEVPFVDVLNTMLDDTLPLTPPEWPEWGNPITDAESFRFIRGYSPYDNVRRQPYPAILAMGGLTDPRVTYWEPAKWIAKLRAHNTSDNSLLLRINMSAGHAGASGRFTHLEEIALTYAFALSVTGKANAA